MLSLPGSVSPPRVRHLREQSGGTTRDLTPKSTPDHIERWFAECLPDSDMAG